MERGGEKRKPVDTLNSNNKRAKSEDDSQGSSFERELMTLASTSCLNTKWSRPSLPALDPKTDSVTFQQLDLDHYIGEK